MLDLTISREGKPIMKTLVIFYSYEGNTKFIAETIAKEAGADILELKVKNDLNSKGFMKFFWGGRQVVFKKTPDLHTFDKNLNDYDLFIIGTPVWAFTFTPALRTFFAQNKLNGKKVAVFCAHEGGPANTLAHMKKELEGNTVVSEMDFLNVLKDPDKNAQKAKDWVHKIIK